MAAKKLNYSFLKGTQKVAKEDYMPLQEALMKALGCTTKQHYYQKRKCIPNIAAHIKDDVEKVFEQYGITDPCEIWDIEESTL
ncbi:hypothetical protein [Parabacteroides gordonii]|jgi:hypothetical protein|uniref:hypothetical protein n=1 Tax=Parabacteroides gordonii TaxID=574930 RepID=UPI00205DDD41|nr:hypothetical protein [Parabacteroides gordonii]DAV65234.1 MAG TPA: hypothetical protein [Caudoviricetes sp.]